MNQIVIFEHEPYRNHIELLSSDDRYQHIVKVLKPRLDTTLKGCILNQGNVQLKLVELNEQKIVFKFDEIMKSKMNRLNLIVSLSRPPSMKKLLEHGSCMGVSDFIVPKAKLSEKSFLESKVFKEDSIAKLFKLGISQSVNHFSLPKFDLLHNNAQINFSNIAPENRFILCPTASEWLSPGSIDFTKDITLAIGCERGFTSDEESFFQEHNFKPIKISNSILRVEIAVYSILSQIELLRNQHD